MQLDQDSCYQALLSRDPRFDGLIYVGVSSTGIYCRIVCPSRRPLKRNCSFFSTPAAAEQAGYRPCLRCRPELAPGNAWIDARSRIAVAIARRIEAGALNDSSVAALASELGISERHLRRVIQAEFGVSPNKLVETQRLLTAKLLLTDTTMPVTEIAFASGFASLRRFNDAFKTGYRMSPSRFRRDSAAPGTPAGNAGQFAFELGYRPPLDWDGLLEFLSRRLYTGVEAILDDSYLRTVRIGDRTGWVRVRQSRRRHALSV
ncbi:MAG: bifunctional transcriptional activator/DNA repair enzyme AdaA, partial [Burkholderiales bacterium]